MRIKKYAPLLIALVVTVAAWLIHESVFYFLGIRDVFFRPLAAVYGFFYACTAVILLVLIFVRENSIDNVGMMFLLLTCIKMGIAYAFMYPAIESGHENLQFEKNNFFIVFAVFLTLETILTIKLLNKR